MWVRMVARRKTRRVQYHPQAVVLRVLSNVKLLTIARIVYSASEALSTKEISMRAAHLGVDINNVYTAVILRKLEKWGLVRCYRNPAGGLLWAPAARGPARLLRQRLKELETQELLQQLEVVPGGGDGSGEKLQTRTIAS